MNGKLRFVRDFIQNVIVYVINHNYGVVDAKFDVVDVNNEVKQALFDVVNLMHDVLLIVVHKKPF